MTDAPTYSTCLWYDTQAAEAAALYAAILDDAEVTGQFRNGPDGPPLMVNFRLGDQRFQALNGGPHYTHSEAASIVVECGSQEQCDRYWFGLIADGGEPSMCGWLKDKFGVSWQIVPTRLLQLMQSSDAAVAARVMAAMLTMSRIDIAALEAAAAAP